MKQRVKRLIVYLLVTLLICQSLGSDVLILLAAENYFDADVTIDTDSGDDYIYFSGAAKSLIVNEGITLSGDVDFSQDSSDKANILTNNGTISGNIKIGQSAATITNNGVITGNISMDESAAQINNYGTISSGSFNLATGSRLYSTGSISSITMEGGDLEVAGGSVGTINDISGSYISLSGCTVGTVSTNSTLNVSGAIQATSLTTAGITSDGTATIDVTDYVKATNGIENTKIIVQKSTIVDTSGGVGYSVYYNDKEYIMAAGSNGTIVDSYGRKVNVAVSDNSHLTTSGIDDNIIYLPGDSITQIILDANDGYYFPENYSDNVTVDGAGSMTVTRVNDTKVTIDYTLAEKETKDITITVTSASLKPKEQGVGTIEISDIHYGADVEVILKSDTNDIQDAKIEYKTKGAPNSEYRTDKPKEVGSYTARATFAENDLYTSCTAIVDFDITYLPIPDKAYVIKGNKGENGFYISKVEIIPRDGYSVAKQLDGTYKKKLIFTSTQDSIKAFYIKNETGEKTKGQKLPNIKIDITLPTMSATHGETYYGETLTVDISDANLSTVTCNSAKVDLKDGKAQLILESNKGSNYYSIYAKDLAGNSKQIAITVADEWLRTGVIPANKLIRLSTNTAYKLDTGMWKVAGDTTQYVGGQSVYVRSGGEYTFGAE